MTAKEQAQQKKQLRLLQEKERSAALRAFERNAVHEKFGSLFAGKLESGDTLLIAGIDEAGRGPLAGPVAAGACILPEDTDILYLNDSKKLSAKKRDALYDVIRREAFAFHVALVDAQRIDEINILQATYEAMRAAVNGLTTASGEKVSPDVLVVDAVTIPELDIPQTGIIKGDAKCASIAAASILAKVTRDRLMEEYDRRYPEYGFAAHKGYGTKAHIEALRKYGPCPIHRRTFITHFIGN